MSSSKWLKHRLEALGSGVRLGQFASAGAVGAVVDFAVLAALVELGWLGPVAAKVIAWEVAVIVIFLINEYWTFAAAGVGGTRALGRRFLRSNLVRVGGFAVTMAVFTALVHGVGVWYLLANAIGIGVGFFVNYAFESLYTWRVHMGENT